MLFETILFLFGVIPSFISFFHFNLFLLVLPKGQRAQTENMQQSGTRAAKIKKVSHTHDLSTL